VNNSISPDATPVSLDSSGGARLHEQVAELRAGGPAVLVRMPGDVVAWSVTRGDVAKRLLAHRPVCKDARKSWHGDQPGAIPSLYPWIALLSMFTCEGDT